jgi:hypothetical protein
MVLGRRRFTWRSDVRGLLSVAGLGLLTLLAGALMMGAVLLLSRLFDAAAS